MFELWPTTLGSIGLGKKRRGGICLLSPGYRVVRTTAVRIPFPLVTDHVKQRCYMNLPEKRSLSLRTTVYGAAVSSSGGPRPRIIAQNDADMCCVEDASR